MRRALICLAVGLVPAALAAGPAKDSCVECHSALADELQKPALAFAKDVHSQHGFSCVDCHGGDRGADDAEAAMSAARGFKGKPARKTVPQLCARCHSDVGLMRRYNPRERVDQYAEYQTSVHGKLIASGDEAAATCIDCHSVHDIRAVKDPLSPVHPLRLPETCARCHADAARMAKYKIPTNQFAEYRQSVHWEALAKRRDLSAPSCASCHGNHGATPPQVSSVAAVCGSCHAMMEDLYDKSAHHDVFAAMNLGGCVVCHSNHGVKMPSTAMLAGEGSVCKQCHEAGSAEGRVATGMAGAITKLGSSLKSSDAVLEQAARSGMEVSEAVMKEQDGREALVKARVAVHTLDPVVVEKAAEAGMAIAAETRHAGEAALKERDFRRFGLLFALVAIAVTIAGLWLAVRALERGAPPLEESGRR
ncbi:MAG: cytochrome c3 family protein [Bryobacteraceae bacterium]